MQSVTSDWGAESGLAELPLVDFDKCFPHYTEAEDDGGPDGEDEMMGGNSGFDGEGGGNGDGGVVMSSPFHFLHFHNESAPNW